MKKLLKTTLISTALLGGLATSAQAHSPSESAPLADVMALLHDRTPIAPSRVFDNVYVIGTKSVVAWAINTPEGIILIDALWDEQDGKMLVEHLAQVGLDAKNIRYILISHGHGDHFGGAQYLRHYSGAKVLVSKTDEALMQQKTGANSNSPVPAIDGYLNDGDTLSLGGTDIHLIATPGHTAGTTSFIFPAREQGKTVMLGLWGGTGIPNDKQGILNYRASIDKFKAAGRKHRIQGVVTAHLFGADDLARVEAAAQRPQAPRTNPLAQGQADVDAFFADLTQKTEQALKTAR